MQLEDFRLLNINSVVLLPLIVDGEVANIFALHTNTPQFFDELEMRLLNELAGDLAFALNNIDKEETLNYLSYYDALTGLANRSHFVDLLQRELLSAERSSRRVILMLISLKRFRKINESLGLAQGDEFLRQTAQRLREIVPHPQTLSRIHGDTFATLFMHDSGIPLDHRIGARLIKELSEPISIGGQTLGLQLVLGAACFPEDGNDALTLLRNAEAALQEAKDTDRQFLFYEPQINARVAATLKLETKLRAALELGQFVLHYQPKMDATCKTFDSVEALIRWQDPESGLVPPGIFIPLLEESGLILQVGEWALNQAVSDIMRWKSMGFVPPRVAVNVSAIQLREKTFTGTVVNALTGFDGMDSMLDIEVTESLVMEDVKRAGFALKTLLNLGVQVSIDDFGTGYSSLSYLAKLPFNILKIDRSFVQELNGQDDADVIVAAMISLAHALHVKVVAEGVETEQQANKLLSLNCDLMQGYLFCKPVPFDEITQMLTRSDS